MKIKVLSDLHLEFDKPHHPFDPGVGDVLVLAGDICVAADYNEDYHEFFMKCVQGYNRVFYVLGNHEHYNGDFNETLNILRTRLPVGITIMNNRSEFVSGVHFIGATMWTNMNNLNADTIETARSCMNDYHVIDNFTPEQSIEEHMQSRDWFERCLPMLRGPVFVITHHAPSTKSVKGRYKGSEGMYSTNMEYFIKKNPNVMYWAHGHVHETSDYMIEQCRVVANPRGYNHSELNPNFNVELEIEISEEECYTELVRS
jgi:Icc-related predicted phosphoesterase